jgi:hypothetical protein
VRRALEHVIESELTYVRVVQHLRGMPVAQDAIEAMPVSADDARTRLDASRAALLEALEGVDEESFYKLASLGREEYSVLSLLENTSNHDREHAAQVRELTIDG